MNCRTYLYQLPRFAEVELQVLVITLLRKFRY